jgi:hypothetical protein
MSRKLRKNVRIQINEGKIYENAILFLNEKFARLTENGDGDEGINTYFDLEKIRSIRTYSRKDA